MNFPLASHSLVGLTGVMREEGGGWGGVIIISQIVAWPLLTLEAAFLLVSTTNRDLGPGPFSRINWEVLMPESFS